MLTRFFLIFIFSLVHFFSFAQTDVSGNIFSNTNWSKDKSPYRLVGNVGIASGVTLKIEPGTVVLFTGQFQILVKGNILAEGQHQDSIKFIGNGLDSGLYSPMLLFQSANLDLSKLAYIEFSNKQAAIKIGEESQFNQTPEKNSGKLISSNIYFDSTLVITSGYGSNASILIESSVFHASSIIGNYPMSERIFLSSCKINGSKIFSDSYNKGISINNSIIEESSLELGCCESVIEIHDSQLIRSPITSGFSTTTKVKIYNSHVNNSPVAAIAEIDGCIISNDGSTASRIYYGLNTVPTIYTLSCSIKNSKIIGVDSIIGIAIPNYIDYDSSIIKNTTITGFKTGVKIIGNQKVEIFNSSITGNNNFAIENNSRNNINAFNNYWGTTDSASVQALNFDYYDDLNKGKVLFNPVLQTYESNEFPMLITYIKEDVSSVGRSEGSINITISGGIPPYKFSWSSGEITEDIEMLYAGIYEVTVTDHSDRSIAQVIEISEPSPLPLSITFSKKDVSTFGKNDGMIDISISGGIPPYIVNWSNGATTEDIDLIYAGIYEVTVTDQIDSSITKSVEITEPELQLLSIASSKTDVSGFDERDGTINITVTGGIPPYSYSWSNGKNTEDLTELSKGIYKVIVTDEKNDTITKVIEILEIVLGIEDLNSPLKGVFLSPNPVVQEFKIETNKSENFPLSVTIFDSQGNRRFYHHFVNFEELKSFSFKTNDYPTGIYLLLIDNGSNKGLIFVKQ